MHRNVWAGFQTAWGKRVLRLLPQKKHILKCKLSMVVVNSATQGQ